MVDGTLSLSSHTVSYSSLVSSHTSQWESGRMVGMQRPAKQPRRPPPVPRMMQCWNWTPRTNEALNCFGVASPTPCSNGAPASWAWRGSVHTCQSPECPTGAGIPAEMSLIRLCAKPGALVALPPTLFPTEYGVPSWDHTRTRGPHPASLILLYRFSLSSDLGTTRA